MRPGSHAAGDGSFRRSAGINLGKAVALVAVALVIGAVLLHRNGGSVNISAAGGSTTTVKKSRTTTTTTTTVETTTTVPPSRAPSSVKVLVANGTSVGGQAALYSNKLHATGYDTLASTNATAHVQATIVYYAPSFQSEAAAIALLLGVQASAVKPLPAQGQVPVANLQGANILVVIGPDLVKTGTGTTVTTRQVTTTSTTRH
jgi:hypothetical protein